MFTEEGASLPPTPEVREASEWSVCPWALMAALAVWPGASSGGTFTPSSFLIYKIGLMEAAGLRTGHRYAGWGLCRSASAPLNMVVPGMGDLVPARSPAGQRKQRVERALWEYPAW